MSLLGRTGGSTVESNLVGDGGVVALWAVGNRRETRNSEDLTIESV